MQAWLKNAWVYPMQGPEERTLLRLTLGGRLKMRRRITELESSLGVSGVELAKQEAAGTLPAEPEKMELAMMVAAYTSERDFITGQGQTLGTSVVTLDETPDAPAEPVTEE